MAAYEKVLRFWFEEIDSKLWWKKDEDFDELIRERFGELHRRASSCELYSWRASARGRLAEIIVLDQFSRNMFRGTPEAFAHDAQALTLAQEAVAAGAEKELRVIERVFLCLPYMHSESLAIHEEAMRLFAAIGLEENLDYEQRHRDIIERFGRYPHRNGILGRESTDEELAFLAQPGSSF